MKNILFLGGFFPEELSSEFFNNSLCTMDFAADTFQKALLLGLKYYFPDNLCILNFPFLGSYPRRYKTMRVSSLTFRKDIHGFVGESVGYINLSYYKKFDIFKKAKKCLINWIAQTSGERVIIVYSFASILLEIAVYAKKLDKDIKVCLLVPDLPNFFNPLENKLERFLSKLLSNLQRKFSLLQYVDFYVLLSKYMAERLAVGSKPWTVVEGIYNPSLDDVFVEKRSSKEKWILYSGTLARRYGIMNLVEAFLKTKNKDYRLVICGKGDTENEINALVKNDPRIIYKGQLERSEVLKLQRQSNLLVNPRTPEGAFTKYSFPSKTMEYLASGIPTLLYKLSGIPDEYYKYCFSLEELGIEPLSREIKEILTKDEKFLFDFGQEARNFILKEKNPVKQCKKIFDLININ